MRRIEYTKGEMFRNIMFLTEIESKPRKAIFKCHCGNEFTSIITNVKFGTTKSCGCLAKKVRSRNGKSNTTHGDTKKHYLYKTWISIKTRCYNTNDKDYHRYGGRGIIMYEGWLKDYSKFKEWMINNLGERPEGYSLDRINNNGNYEPNNLRWATPLKQRHNQERNA